MKRCRQFGLGWVAACVLIALAAGTWPCRAGEDLELSIVVGNNARYVAPDGRKILIQRQPTEFAVQIRNTAEVSKHGRGARASWGKWLAPSRVD